jgi:hypothetical protein
VLRAACCVLRAACCGRGAGYRRERAPCLFVWVRRETGKEQGVQVPDNKDVANHVVPESCAAHREVQREALTGVRIGQPLSRDRNEIPGADAVHTAEGNTTVRAIASAQTTRRGLRPWHVRTLLVREPGDLGSDQPLYRAGPYREGEEP